MTDSKCQIWGTPAKAWQAVDGMEVESPRAGGKYYISGSAIAVLGNKDTQAKRRLTSWIYQQNKLGNKWPQITTYTLEDVESHVPPSVADRAEAIIDLIGRKIPEIGSYLPIQFSNDDENYLLMLAASASTEVSEVEFLIDYLENVSLITQFARSKSGTQLQLTLDAFSYLERKKETNEGCRRVFVAMWFDKETEEAYNKGIAQAVLEYGYEPVRIDRQEFLGSIPDEIIAQIRQSRFLIADFTDGGKPRGGVYYEAGFAHGLGIQVILTARDTMFDKPEKIHFDTRHLNHIAWSTPEDLKAKLVARIGAVIE